MLLQPLWQHFDIVARLLQFMRVINFTNSLQAGGRGIWATAKRQGAE